MEFGLSFLTVPEADPVAAIEIAAQTGYSYVGLRLVPATPAEQPYPLLTDKKIMRDVNNSIKATGVKVLDIELVRIDEFYDRTSNLRLLDTAAEIGASVINVCCNEWDESLLNDRFIEFCQDAAPFGLSCDIEFLPWSALKNVKQTQRFLQKVNQPNAALMIDSLHWDRSDTSLAEIKSLPPELMNYVQVCDALKAYDPHTDELLRVARTERLMPGDGELDLRGFLSLFPTNKPLCLEVPNPTLYGAIPLKQRAELALQKLKAILNQEAGHE